MRSPKQKLVDIMFEIAMHSAKSMQGKTNEEIAEWVRSQLLQCGIKTEPCGASWGVLIND